MSKETEILDFAEKAISFYNGERTTVELICDRAAMNSVLDHFGDAAKTSKVDDDHFRLIAEVCLSPTFFAWVFRFCGKAKLAAPKAAVEKYQRMLAPATEQSAGRQ